MRIAQNFDVSRSWNQAPDSSHPQHDYHTIAALYCVDMSLLWRAAYTKERGKSLPHYFDLILQEIANLVVNFNDVANHFSTFAESIEPFEKNEKFVQKPVSIEKLLSSRVRLETKLPRHFGLSPGKGHRCPGVQDSRYSS